MEILNIYASLVGWLAFNCLMWRIEKNKYDREHKAFPFKQYALESVDDWITSLVFVPVILFIGYWKLSLNPFGDMDVQHAAWSDLYYLCSGFVVEVVTKAYEKWKSK